MSRRTYEKDADFVEVADDLENLVADKRISWRASATKANRLTYEILKISK